MNRYWEEIYFAGYQNNKLYGKLYTTGSTDEWGVVLCHGLGTDSREFGEFGNLLAERGINCLEFDYSGHGKSSDRRGLTTKENHFHDTRAAVDVLVERGFRKITIVGHSLGAHAALRIQAISTNVSCSALLCPQTRSGASLSPIQYLFFCLLGYFYRLIGVRFSFKIPLCPDYEMVFSRSDLAKQAAEIGFLSSGLNSASLAYLAFANNLPLLRRATKPVLVVMARNDRKVSTKMVYNEFRMVSNANVFFEFLQNSGHSVFMSEDRERLADVITRFVKNHS